MERLLLRSEIIFNRRGMILLITLLFLLLLTIMGTSSLYLAFTETVLGRSIEADARAFYKGDSGVEQVLYWFNNPDGFSGTPEDFFRRRRLDNTSFFDESGVSQYAGTPESPDLSYSMADIELIIYGPSMPGALCTVESTGISGRIRRTVTVELFDDTSGVRSLRGTWRAD